ncbi:Phthiocerol synthesis polyketide synthase type I PpsC [Stieleria maiorica]|uniref:Phthiocerol synthesis polyketide synthase type I PpsC n=1 Tax=Stieleria maiorica TaxID=2795974 RepID=A0A5B9MAT0_9BACT|nr:type I polyketide synthase [Stieleria maiorica]QEF97170.1 Phthiocerol synthesis polyketide synthase type I PpsC [Stieleria maiorica]
MTDFQPIAIIGMGCRFPGGCDSPESYWNLLESGRDAIKLTPPDRWSLEKFYAPGQARLGKTQSRWGGYVDGIDQFDPQLFGISPREAASMDPQQRLLLETAYRATEDAGIPLESMAGRPVSVHVGISSFDYAVAALSPRDRGVIGPYSNTGGSSSIAANRISYCFDLRGESVAVDTACSSSLIAMHLACQSLQSKANHMALAGGVNALILPDFFVAFSQLGVLSPDGRCKTFDAAANGYVRGEGAGMVLMKRLDDAVADSDSIYAVIHGSATNQDGRTDGMTVPSQSAQQALIRSALQTAGLDGHDISYVEAHGTGTPIGDPIEARAIANCYGRNDKDAGVCRIGSVKTNIGHLEAGAGIASVMKVALSLKHQTIPAHLNLETLNPEIEFDANGLRVPRNTERWDCDGPRLAGINGFGYGGANAHLILGQPPQQTPAQSTPKSDGAPILLPISAHDKHALAETASRLADWIDQGNGTLPAIAATAARRRTHHDWRGTVVGSERNQWVGQLRDIAADCDAHATRVHHPSRGRETPAPPIAFVCSGQGPQWWAMGRGLLESDPIFRASIQRCDREFAQHVSWSLLDELTRGENESRMNETAIAQPSLFALQIALAAVWESKGIRPSLVVGHSVGEIAAAHLSGALDFHDACLVAIHRGRTMDAATSKGAMIAVGLSRQEIEPWIADVTEHVSIAAINGPSSLTVSGRDVEIEAVAERLDQAGIFCRRLEVEYAFHSPQMAPVRDELLKSLAGIRPQPSHTPMVSTVTGGVLSGPEVDGEYWWKNVRHSVRFADAMDVLADRGIELAIEIGPHPVLRYAIAECFADQQRSILAVASLDRKKDDATVIADSIGQLYAWGYPIDWTLNSPADDDFIKLPAMAMNQQSLWSESFDSKSGRMANPGEPILGQVIGGPQPGWQTRVDLRMQESLADHRVRNACMMPAAAMLELAITAESVVAESDAVSLKRFRMQNPCMLSEESPVRVQIDHDTPRRQILLSSSGIDQANWQTLATVDASSIASVERTGREALEDARRRCTESISPDRLYKYCDQLGLNYGPRFRGVTQGWRTPYEAIVTVEFSNADASANGADPLGDAAALLDSCFHGMILASPVFDAEIDRLYLPQQIASLDVFHKSTAPLTAHVRLLSKDDYRMVADIDIYDVDQNHCVAIRGFESVSVSGAKAERSINELLYRYVWKPSAQADAATPETPIPETAAAETGQRKWLVFCDQSGLSSNLLARLPISDKIITVQHGSSFKRLRDHSLIIDPENREQFDRLLTDIGDGVTDVVYLWGLDSPDNVELSVDVLNKSTVLTTLAPMHLAAAWQAAADSGIQSNAARLSIVTLDAQPADGGAPDEGAAPISVAAGPLIGFGRVIAAECGRLKTRLVDLSSGETMIAKDLSDELVSRIDDEDEVMLRDSIRWVRRFVPADELPLHPESRRRAASVLRCGEAASIDQLRYESAAPQPPAGGEVEIEVLATGLNFSDVMKSLDLYPGLPDGPVSLGAECSGRISRVGPDVTEFNVGDEVFAVAPGSFATHVIVNEHLVAKKPPSVSHQQAATIPIAFLTAEYALNECALIRRGESVLIHSASGGVGIAAMQLAKLAGATVLATAGTDEKREFVKQLGAELVMNSRDLEFARQTLRQTDGVGVDVILNSLPGEAIPKGLSILKTGGRFLEIGKRDIYADASLGLETFKNNLALFAIDLDQLFREQPERMGRMLRQLAARFDSGELTPLPVTSYDADETREAFRFMQQGKHIGKVVVDYRSGPSDVFAGSYEPLCLSDRRTYWVAGGLGGFGLRVARWLIDCGAKHLVLGGRSADVPAETQQTLDQWTEAGITVTVIPVDLTSTAAVRSAVDQIDRDCPPLAGVFHTAMVLEDRLLVDMDRETLERVLGPKVLGGWNLHAATEDHDLDHFVLFSSLSSVFGHAGQANYAAANALLDSLAHYRRSIGMPGLAVNWGHVGQVGYLARRGELSERLERQGVLTFSADEAMQCLEQAMQTDVVQQSVLRMDWTRWRGLGITGDVSPRFAHLLRGVSEEATGGDRLASAAEVRAANAEARGAMVARIIGSKAASLLGIAADKMPWDRPLLSMGLDSLMAVEMRNWIESRLEIDLPISELMRSESLREVCRSVSTILETDSEQATPDVTDGAETSGATAAELLHQLPQMSDASVDALLTDLLSGPTPGQPSE